MKKEGGDDNEKNSSADFHIRIVDATPQANACKAMMYMLRDPDRMSWERAQMLTIADITAIRALRKTIVDNLVPSGGCSIEDWKSTIESVVETFANMPARYMMMKDPNAEEGFKRIAKDIRDMLAGASPAHLLKEKQEERKGKEQQEQVEPDKEKK
jgi:hypothetical protein